MGSDDAIMELVPDRKEEKQAVIYGLKFIIIFNADILGYGSVG